MSTNLKAHRAYACHGVHHALATMVSSWGSRGGMVKVVGAMTCEAVKLCVAGSATISLGLCTSCLPGGDGVQRQALAMCRAATTPYPTPAPTPPPNTNTAAIPDASADAVPDSVTRWGVTRRVRRKLEPFDNGTTMRSAACQRIAN